MQNLLLPSTNADSNKYLFLISLLPGLVLAGVIHGGGEGRKWVGGVEGWGKIGEVVIFDLCHGNFPFN